ncbi:unnamed protein product, partial [Nesidiocoris tenuis]
MFFKEPINQNIPQMKNGHVANGHVANGHLSNGHLSNGHLSNGNGVKRKRVSNGRMGGKRRKRRTSDLSAQQADEFEVEKITAHSKAEDKIVAYKVKWAGYPVEESTWEGVENVGLLLGKLGDYFQNLIYPGRGRVVFRSEVELLRKEFSNLSQATVDAFCCKYLNENGHTIEIDEDEAEEDLIDLSRIPAFARDRRAVEKVRKSWQLIEFKRRRTRQLEALKSWESELNLVSTDPAPLIVVNGVDLDGPPANFHWINKNITDVDVKIPDDNPLYCKCEGGCHRVECCWKENCIGKPYTIHGHLRFARGTPVYECNKNCQCGPNCGNRILQKGRQVRVAIFKTYNGIGWGVRALEDIAESQFVVEYVGELVKFETAEHRGRTYDRHGCTYLFDLDFANKDPCPYTLDAAMFGNASHFINHSCNPNLAVWAVYVDCINPDLPRLGLYATRKIKAGEELSFDYVSQSQSGSPKKRYANAKIYKCDNPKCPRPGCYISGGSSKDDTLPCLRANCNGHFQLVRHVSFVDCPGHDILMATMLNGAAVMDAALLLIAGNESCPQPQTSEHLAAIEIMKLKHIVILQNKIDLVKEAQAKEQYEQILKFVQGVGTKIEPTLCRADRLVGQVLGAVGALPKIFVELEISYYLLKRLLGVRMEGDKKGAK